MTSMQHQSTDQGSSEPRQPDISTVSTDASSTEIQEPSFGSRLRAAREARGLDIEACAHALKLPARILRQVEHDQYDGIDSKIYLGSYLSKYGRHLGINEATIQVELDRIKQTETPLVATGGISHSRFLLDRYATAATYVVLTAVIVVPIIWLGVRGALERDLSHLAPLDATPVVQEQVVDNQLADGSDAQAGQPLPLSPPQVAPEPEQQDQPLLASMAPFPNLDSSLSPAPVKAAKPVLNAAAHSLDLSLSEASWVEVTGADGTRLEYGLLPAGSDKTYHSDQPLEVRIGNVSGAQVRIDGQPVGLDDFRRANVAHFGMKLQDGKASAASL